MKWRPPGFHFFYPRTAMYTLRQMLTTLQDSDGLFRTLRDLRPLPDEKGHIRHSTGNSAAVFPVLVDGERKALRCYFRPMPRLKAIYRERLLEREMYLFTSPRSGEWCDVVLTDWIEGQTLGECVRKAAESEERETLQHLAHAFDALARKLLDAEWAHGDLKPDNLIVDAQGTLHLIDFDGVYLPQFLGMAASEVGTAAFQHPLRTAAEFDRHIDDYAIALLSTALHALAIHPALYGKYAREDGFLLSSYRTSQSEAFREICTLFQREGAAARYRLARLLVAPTPRLKGLAALLEFLTDTPEATEMTEVYVRDGLWGFRTPTRELTPPLWEAAFDFTEEKAAVRLNGEWFFIDTRFQPMLHCPQATAVKPFRGGKAVIITPEGRKEIDTEGHVFEICG